MSENPCRKSDGRRSIGQRPGPGPQLGSVTVPHLFEVQRYGSVLQMASTVMARLRDDMTLADIFNALYPCGSIAGAPKPHDANIRELETAPRGYYTGAIGCSPPHLSGVALAIFACRCQSAHCSCGRQSQTVCGGEKWVLALGSCMTAIPRRLRGVRIEGAFLDGHGKRFRYAARAVPAINRCSVLDNLLSGLKKKDCGRSLLSRHWIRK